MFKCYNFVSCFQIRNEAVIGRLLYTGATVRHCHMFMLNRQRRILEKYTASLEEAKSELAVKKQDLRLVDSREDYVDMALVNLDTHNSDYMEMF